MKKWLGLIVVLVISSGVFAWRLGWLPTKTESNDILTFVPADTVYYFGGKSSKEMAEFMRGYSLDSISPSQAFLWHELLGSLEQESSPKALFFNYLIDSFSKYNNNTLGGLMDFSGLSLSSNSALFSDGLIPVFRMELANATTFNSLIEEAVKESQWQYTLDELGTLKTRLWKLNDEDGKPAIYLAIANNEKTAIISLVTSLDDLKAKQHRFGVVKPKKSLADMDINELKERYNYTDEMLGFIDFNGIAQAVLSPKSNRLGRDLEIYIPKRKFAALQDEIPTECRDELSELATQVPRLVMGYQAVNINKDTMQFNMHSILEIKNKSVLSQLQKMQGHLPKHSMVSSDKLLTLGLAVNTQTLIPALTSLWTQFTSAKFNCGILKDAQVMIRKTNPAMLGITLSMAQGVKGVGLSVFDLEMSPNELAPRSIDFIANIATDNPTMLMAMAKMLPFLKGVELPTDGSEVALNLAMIPSTMKVKAAIKGKNIVVFSGDKSALVANELINETIETNGVYSTAISYRKIGKLVRSDTLNNLFSQTGGITTCIENYQRINGLDNLNLDMSIVVNVENEGIATKYRGSMDKPANVNTDISGKYRVEYLDVNCQWQSNSFDTINSNSTGHYTDKSDDNQCDLYVSNYKWVKKGRVVTFTGQDQSRESCTDELSLPSDESYVCHLINVTADSFQCLYDPGTNEVNLSRYIRM